MQKSSLQFLALINRPISFDYAPELNCAVNLISIHQQTIWFCDRIAAKFARLIMFINNVEGALIIGDFYSLARCEVPEGFGELKLKNL